MPGSQAICSQCGKPAIGSIQGANVCVDCYSRFEAAQTQRMRELMALHNYFSDEADWLIGFPVGGPRFELPPPTPVFATRGPVNFHNISVQGSVIGAINTGKVQSIDVTIDQAKVYGRNDLAEALKEFTEAVLNSQDISPSQKADSIDQLSYLGEQIRTPAAKRSKGMIRSAIGSIGAFASTSTALVGLWEKLHPLLQSLFN